MGQVLKDAATEDVPITLNKEESALGMGKRKFYAVTWMYQARLTRRSLH